MVCIAIGQRNNILSLVSNKAKDNLLFRIAPFRKLIPMSNRIHSKEGCFRFSDFPTGASIRIRFHPFGPRSWKIPLSPNKWLADKTHRERNR